MLAAHKKRPARKYVPGQAAEIDTPSLQFPCDAVKRPRRIGADPLPWVQEFRQDDDGGKWPPSHVRVLFVDDGDDLRVWGIDRSVKEHAPESWHVPADAIVPAFAAGYPPELVRHVEHYQAAAEEFGQPRLSAMLRRDAGCMEPTDEALLNDDVFSSMVGQLHTGDLSLIELLRWTGQRFGDCREEVEARLVDFCWIGR